MHASTHGKRCVLRTLKAEKVLNLRHRNYFSAVEYKDAVECVVEKFHCNIVTHTNTHNFRRNAKSTLPHIAWLTDFTASLRIVFLFISVPLKSFIQVNRMKNLSHSSYSKRRKLMRTKKKTRRRNNSLRMRDFDLKENGKTEPRLHLFFRRYSNIDHSEATLIALICV